MFAKITEALRRYSFSDHELDLIKVRLTRTELKKGDFLLKAGQICSGVHFVDSGSLVQFRQLEEVDAVDNLFLPGDWIVDNLSFVARKPAVASIVAFEESTVIGLNIQSIHELIGISQAFLRIGSLLESRFPGADDVRNIKSIDDRYLELLDKRPMLFQVFPLKYIASYLQITPETLSRIRSRIKGTVS